MAEMVSLVFKDFNHGQARPRQLVARFFQLFR